jgi:arylsulfatase A-like enzyme
VPRKRIVALAPSIAAKLAWVCLLAACARVAALPDPGTPNVLLLTLDTTRADHLGCYGGDVRTPNIDALAASGVLFLANVAPSQCTNPSHASILTGLYPVRHGVYDNQTALAEGATTLAEILRAEGYATFASVSARHLNPGNSAFSQGFDVFLECDRDELSAGEGNRRLAKFFEEGPGRSFFLWVHYFDPHGLYEPPEPFSRMYPVQDLLGDEVLPSEWRHVKVDPDLWASLYKGEISYMDHEIGWLLERVRSWQTDRQTLVVLVADHGESLVEKGLYFAHAGLYNQVTHVPLILSLPGVLPPGRKVMLPTSSVDVLPTVLGLLGLADRIPEVDGRNLLPALVDDAIEPHRFLFCEAVDGAIRAVYHKGYKYILPAKGEWSMPEDHLYRFLEDPLEQNDLKTLEPKRAASLRTALHRWLRESAGRSLGSVRHERSDSATEEMLEAAGYLRRNDEMTR